MANPKDFLEMMLETVVVYSQSSVNKYGNQSYSASGTSYRCRFVYDSRMVRDSEGREVLESGRAILYGVATASVRDKISLPDGRTPLITTVSTIKDENGNHHSVIGFG
jgi:hypothetical protein